MTICTADIEIESAWRSLLTSAISCTTGQATAVCTVCVIRCGDLRFRGGFSRCGRWGHHNSIRFIVGAFRWHKLLRLCWR